MKFIAFTDKYESVIFEAENITDARYKVINSLDMSQQWYIREYEKMKSMFDEKYDYTKPFGEI